MSLGAKGPAAEAGCRLLHGRGSGGVACRINPADPIALAQAQGFRTTMSGGDYYCDATAALEV